MVLNVTDTTMSLSWTLPQMPNGIITHYQVQYRRSDSSSSSSSTFTSLSTTSVILTYTVTELISDTEYVFRVRAFTVVGHGPSSNEVTRYTSKLQ